MTKKVLKLFLILVAAYFALCAIIFAVETISTYGGKCTKGFFNAYTVDCGILEYAADVFPWTLILFMMIGLWWLLATVIITFLYWVWLYHGPRPGEPPTTRHRVYFTILGLLVGITLAIGTYFLPIAPANDLWSAGLMYLAIIGIPIVIGNRLDEKRHQNQNDPNKTPTI